MTTSPQRPVPLRVASVPATHVYVRHLDAPDEPPLVRRLPERATGPGPVPWYPPQMLLPQWVREHRAAFDVFHVHFGFDGRSPAELAELGRTLAELAVPLVLTVHDLRNPHHDDRALHDAQLHALVRAAAAIVTLTPGAAAELGRRWGRTALVLPHPHVVPLDRPRRARRPGAGRVVGLHAKSVRPNMAVLRVATAAAATIARVPGVRLRIDLHDEVVEPGTAAFRPDVTEGLRALRDTYDCVDLVEHPYFDDEELWDYLERLDVSLLPYAWGTHSGWLEACADLGTAVVAPSCGYYAQQRPCAVYGHDDDGLDVASLDDALRRAIADGPPRPADRVARARQRRALARAHHDLYHAVLGRTLGAAPARVAAAPAG